MPADPHAARETARLIASMAEAERSGPRPILDDTAAAEPPCVMSTNPVERLIDISIWVIVAVLGIAFAYVVFVPTH